MRTSGLTIAIAVASSVAHATALAQAGDNWVGKRVLPKASTFTLRVNDEPVPQTGKPMSIYLALRADGPALWLVPEQTGPSGWAQIGDVVVIEQADDYFTQQLGRRPDEAFLHAMRGLVRREHSEYQKALEDFTAAIRLEPADASLYCERGRAELDHGDHNPAVADFGEALRIDSKCSAALLGRGACQLARKDYYKAIADFSEAIWHNRLATSAYVNRGLAWSSFGEHEKAIIDYDLAIRLDPQQSVAFCHRAHARAVLERYAKALADYDEAIRLDPRLALAYEGRAWLLAACPDGKIRNGKEAVASAIKACELSRWQDPQPLATLAAAWAEAGDFERAVQWQTKANAILTEPNARAVGQARLAQYREKRLVRDVKH
jgi:tetratricopeptide (TPR) repeat protein